MTLLAKLEAIIRSDNYDDLQSSLPKQRGVPRKALRACLELAMPNARVSNIEILIALGADLTFICFAAAIERGDPEVFLVFLKYGWCGNGEEEREGCCIEGVTASDYIHKRAE
jgi:hypothetical protein